MQSIIGKLKPFLFIFPMVCVFFLNNCGNNNKINDERDYCSLKTDTLESKLTQIKKQISFNLNEFETRKEEMDEQLKSLKFIDPNKVTEEIKKASANYYMLFQKYKPLASEYKNLVLETENIFYDIKALRKSVQTGYYDKKIEEFKKEYAMLQNKTDKILHEATETNEGLKAIEPMYMRLEKTIGEFLEKNEPKKE